MFYFFEERVKPFGLIMSARLQRRYNQPKPIYKHKRHLKKHLKKRVAFDKKTCRV